MILNDINKGETRVEWPTRAAINGLPRYLSEIGNIMYSDFSSPYPSLEKRNFTSGPKVVIRGTRISVANIIGYLYLGESPENVAGNILPINLVQLFEAIQYYAEHKNEINKEIVENSEVLTQKRNML